MHIPDIGFLDIGRHPYRFRIMHQRHPESVQGMLARVIEQLVDHAVHRGPDGVLVQHNLLRLNPCDGLFEFGLEDGEVIVDQADFLAGDAGGALVGGGGLALRLRAEQVLRSGVERVLGLVVGAFRNPSLFEQVLRPVMFLLRVFEVRPRGLDRGGRRPRAGLARGDLAAGLGRGEPGARFLPCDLGAQAARLGLILGEREHGFAVIDGVEHVACGHPVAFADGDAGDAPGDVGRDGDHVGRYPGIGGGDVGGAVHHEARGQQQEDEAGGDRDSLPVAGRAEEFGGALPRCQLGFGQKLRIAVHCFVPAWENAGVFLPDGLPADASSCVPLAAWIH